MVVFITMKHIVLLSIFVLFCGNLSAQALDDFNPAPEPTDSLRTEVITEPADSLLEQEVYPKWRFVFQGGYGFRTAGIDPDLDGVKRDHLKKLRGGLEYGVNATYYFNHFWGIGLISQSSHFNHSVDVIVNYNDGRPQQSGKLEDSINIWFLGPMVSFPLTSPGRPHQLILNISLGYLRYHDSARLIDPYVIKGWTIGQLVDWEYGWCLTDNFSLGGSISFMDGTLSTVHVTDSDGKTTKEKLDEEERDDLGMINVSIGFRYFF